MPGSMSRADLIADLKASLLDTVKSFKAPADADFIRHLDHAAQDFSRVRRRVLSGSVVLVANQDSYDAPANAITEHSLQWGRNQKRDLKPWDVNWLGALPRIDISGDPSFRQIIFSPAPSQRQIALLGSACPFRYYAGHSIDVIAANTTIKAEDRALLLLRASAEAMRELANRNVTKATSVGSGLMSSPKNGTPAALYDQLMKSFERQAIG